MEKEPIKAETGDGLVHDGNGLFYALIQNSSDIITIMGTDGTIRYESPSISRILGYNPDELTGVNAFELIHPDDVRRAWEAFKEILRNPTLALSAEFRFRHKDGSWRMIEATGSNQLQNPLISGIVVNSRDVTERRKTEALLWEATKQAGDEKAKSEAIIAAIGDGISVQDTEFRILYMNETAIHMFGDRVGEYCYRVYEHREQVCEDCPLAMSFADGRVHRRERRNPTRTLEVEITASPVRDASARIIAGVEAVRDITGRKMIEEKLRESEERFRRIFEDGPLGMIITDPDFKILKVNKAFCEMLGYTEQGLEGHRVEEFTCKEDMERISSQVSNRGIPFFQVEQRYVKRNQETLWVNLTATAIRDQEGCILYAICMVEDISDRKWAEREREKLICELQTALANIKTLRGLIPMCAWCKKIRDDRGYWQKVETYIQEHSDASFTHGICPECLKKQDPRTYDDLFSSEDVSGNLHREKRRLERKHLEKPLDCSLHVNAGGPKRVALPAVIENINKEGMCVRMDTPLKKGCMVVFNDGKDDKAGVVRWRTQDEGDTITYRVGIEFVREYNKS